MSALTGYIIKQVERTTQSAKRLRAIMVLMLVIANAGAVLLFRAAPPAIEYEQRYIVPTPAVLCPGDTFTYQVSIRVNQPNSVSYVTEGWCYVKGICPKTMQAAPYDVNFIDPYQVSAPATRTVPTTLPPGKWELRHCNTTRYSVGNDEPRQDVACYGAVLTVKDCEVQP
ncbi:MAG: hypothetical protein IPK44_01435 [Candidatus Accumulibacter sp.]|uniref:hypothetical protein n=1 Tax=Accumulibacter sp. TaxID=2053492 RepID=UPI00258320A3|nr:hypothetical protein [Accumulibacter sp.]MBK8113262.1 hypothetical protein [Accumulibacter sp.]